jgi:hypothetical protein
MNRRYADRMLAQRVLEVSMMVSNVVVVSLKDILGTEPRFLRRRAVTSQGVINPRLFAEAEIRRHPFSVWTIPAGVELRRNDGRRPENKNGPYPATTG